MTDLERATKEAVDAICKEAADQGKLIEAGWLALRMTAIHPAAPPNQLAEMRMAYFAGAQHLFSSIMGTLDPDADPTEADLRRMDLIDQELKAWLADYKLSVARPQGSG